MPDIKYSVKDAIFTSYRLKEVLSSMRAIWNTSRNETSVDSPIDIYVVDTDVIFMFMAPIQRHNYGALLRYGGHARKDKKSELMKSEINLTSFLANLIFFELRPNIPLLLLPSHAEEINLLLNNIWERSLSELGNLKRIHAAIAKSASNVVEVSKTKLTIAEDASSGTGKNADTIEMLINEIVNSLRGSGDTGKLFRFGGLSKKNRLSHIDQIMLIDDNGKKCYLPPPLNEEGRYLPSVSRLAERLRRTMSRICSENYRSKKYTITRDAHAISHLAWLNELFQQEKWYIDTGDASARQIRRAVLISGSNLMPRAIDELELRPLRGCVASPLSFLGHSFMDKYFRSTAAYNDTYTNKTYQGSQASALINFFDSIHSTLDSAIRSRNTEKISDAVVQMREEYSELSLLWQARQLFSENSRIDEVTEAILSLKKSGKTLHGLEKFIEELTVDAWQNFARSVTTLSIKSVANNDAVQRNIPPVRFYRFDVAKNISNALYCTGDSEKARIKAKLILDKATVFELLGEDPSHYTEFVCYSLFGLVHRTLRSAEGCAEVAWSIAQEKPTKGKFSKYIKGDEALYLLAHIIRLRARRPSHINRAESVIKLAIEASKHISEVDNTDYIEDIRLHSELFSIHCHQRYFDCFGSVGPWHQMSDSKFDPNQLTLTYHEGNLLLESLNKGIYANEDSYIVEYVKQQLLVNLVQIGLLRLYPVIRTGEVSLDTHCYIGQSNELAKHAEELKIISTQLIEQCNKLDKDTTEVLPKPSILSTSVAAVANLVFYDRNDLNNWFLPNEGKVAAIDGLRFKFLESVYNSCAKR